MPDTRELKTRNAAALWAGIRRLGSYLPSPVILFFIALIVWVLSGVFVVGPDEVGVVKTFGRNARTEDPGIHYHLPYPISTVLKPKVGRIYRLEFGGDAVPAGADAAPNPNGSVEEPPAPVPSGVLMLSGDENLVDVRFSLQYRISNEEKYLFKLAEPETTIRAAAEAAMRGIVGRTTIDDILTTGKQKIVEEFKTDLQAVLDLYNSGVKVVAVQLQTADPPPQVREAFKAVVAAREKVNSLVNEAQGYANEVVPEAQGRAAALEREAEAYLEERSRRAEGEANRFLALLEESRKAGDVTRTRLYLETMEQVLANAGAIVLEPEEKSVMPFLWNTNQGRSLTAPETEPETRQ